MRRSDRRFTPDSESLPPRIAPSGGTDPGDPISAPIIIAPIPIPLPSDPPPTLLC
jgi:hypothetical protein